ncbi:putative plant self-incompatibility S1 [Rosa chinensis]|uniref:S-protein homolog n=1 Tax=Rosa chinensis TaxID=74649 RepID=A0A2P6QPZ2_ROSCH|nr:putative plant self-incompatibility S1 [Rosa chinensis]
MASFVGRTVKLILLLLFLTTTCDAKTYVGITNDLGGGMNLTFHCKSADDELGVKVLPPQQYYEFSFKPTLIGRTDFYCSFQ